MPDREEDEKNRELIEALRNMVDVMAKRLTPDVEPALVYVVKPSSTEDLE